MRVERHDEGESFPFCLWGTLDAGRSDPRPISGEGDGAGRIPKESSPARPENLPLKLGVAMKTANPARSARRFKQDWEKLYRAALFESQPSRLLHRIKDAEDAIIRRFENLSAWPDNNRKEQDALTRAQHILSMLRQAGQGP